MSRYLLALLLLPMLASAATMQAGFPSQPLWVSTTEAAEGETIVVSAVVVNDTAATLLGTLAFFANDTRIGVREFELPSGKSQIHSIEWKPKKGEYQLAAKIEGTSAQLSQKETPSITITVKEPPAPPSELQQTITQVVQTGSSIASSSAPVVIQAAQNIFSQTEALRNAGIEKLEKYLASNAAAGAEPQGAVAGTSTSNTTGFDVSENKGDGVFSNVVQTAAAAALFAFKNVALFYPILALLILGTLYFLARRIRRKPAD